MPVNPGSDNRIWERGTMFPFGFRLNDKELGVPGFASSLNRSKADLRGGFETWFRS